MTRNWRIGVVAGGILAVTSLTVSSWGAPTASLSRFGNQALVSDQHGRSGSDGARSADAHHETPAVSGDRAGSGPGVATGDPPAAGATATASGSVPVTMTPAPSAAADSAALPLTQADGTGNGTVLFNGTAISSWWLNQSATPTRIQSVRDPAGGPGTALRFTAYNTDVAPLTPTKNPRAQLITRTGIVKQNTWFWESYEVYIPSAFPMAQNTSWLALGSPFYGQPFTGSPSTGIAMSNGKFRWSTDGFAPKPWAMVWQQQAPVGRWVRFTWHIYPSTNGFAELYVNGQPLLVTYNGKTQYGINIPVIDAGENVGPWFSQLSVYYQLNEFSQATLYFRDFGIGTTKSAAESVVQ